MNSPLQIRNVPEETRRALKARAAARGESLNAYLLHLINREVARPTVGEVLDQAASRAERATGSALDVVTAARAEREEQLHYYLHDAVHAQAVYLRRQAALARTAERLGGRAEVPTDERRAVLDAIADAVNAPKHA